MNGPKLLRTHLRAVGLTPAAFGRATRISESLLSRWLRGTRRPGLDHAEALERFTDGAVPASSWTRRSSRQPRASAS